MTLIPFAFNPAITEAEWSNKSMSYICTFNDVSSFPDNCHCQVVPGVGTQMGDWQSFGQLVVVSPPLQSPSPQRGPIGTSGTGGSERDSVCRSKKGFGCWRASLAVEVSLGGSGAVDASAKTASNVLFRSGLGAGSVTGSVTVMLSPTTHSIVGVSLLFVGSQAMAYRQKQQVPKISQVPFIACVPFLLKVHISFVLQQVVHFLDKNMVPLSCP
jgi:hypothetical protein